MDSPKPLRPEAARVPKEKKKSQLIIIYPTKLFLKDEFENKTSPEKQKLREFITSNSAL